MLQQVGAKTSKKVTTPQNAVITSLSRRCSFLRDTTPVLQHPPTNAKLTTAPWPQLKLKAITLTRVKIVEEPPHSARWRVHRERREVAFVEAAHAALRVHGADHGARATQVRPQRLLRKRKRRHLGWVRRIAKDGVRAEFGETRFASESFGSLHAAAQVAWRSSRCCATTAGVGVARRSAVFGRRR